MNIDEILAREAVQRQKERDEVLQELDRRRSEAITKAWQIHGRSLFDNTPQTLKPEDLNRPLTDEELEAGIRRNMDKSR